MRGKRVERRFGWDTHGLPAELEAQRQLGHQDQAGHRRARHRPVQRRVPQSVLRVHRRVARLRDAPGPLGRLRPRLQDARARLHGVGHLGVQAAPRQGPGLRGLPRAALLLERPDAAVQPRAADGRRRLQDAPGPGRHGRACGSRPASCALVWTTTPWTLPANLGIMVGPDIDYVVVESDVTGTTERYVIGEARLAAYAKDLFGPDVDRLRSTSGSSSGSRAPTCSAARSRRPSPTTRGTNARTTSSRPTSSPPRTAPGSSTRPVPSVRRTRSSPTRRASSPSCRSGPTAGSLARHRLRGHARLRRERPHHRPPQGRHPRRGRDRLGDGGHGAAAPRDLRPQLPALLALPRAPHLHGGVVVVRRGDEDQGADARAQPGDRVDALAHQGRPVRQVARQRPRLVHLAKPLLGQPDPRVEVRQPGVPARRRLRLVRGARARLRRRGHRPAPAVHRQPDAAEPGRPDRAARRCAASRTSSTSGSTPAR